MFKKDKNNLKISVVLSFLNEENTLLELITRLRTVFKHLINKKEIGSYELVFINDNSVDNSETIIKSQMIKKDIVLINMSRNFGVSECVLAGFTHSKGDLIIYMDTDLQDPPELIPELIQTWLIDPDTEVVYTTRNRRHGENWLKLLVTKLGYRFINSISDIELQIDSGDYKLLSRKVVNHVLSLKEPKPYLRGLISWVGFKQKQVRYDRDPRFDGADNTKMNVMSKKVLYYWVDRALISFSDGPLKIILIIGIFASILSFGYLFFVIFSKLMGHTIPGWAAIISAVIFLGSLNILMLGFVGLYLSSIFNASKNRPRYIIKEIIRS